MKTVNLNILVILSITHCTLGNSTGTIESNVTIATNTFITTESNVKISTTTLKTTPIKATSKPKTTETEMVLRYWNSLERQPLEWIDSEPETEATTTNDTTTTKVTRWRKPRITKEKITVSRTKKRKTTITHTYWDPCTTTLHPSSSSLNYKSTRIPTGQQGSTPNNSEPKRYQFGNVTVNARTIFHKTNLSLAMVNLRCVVPGHVLVFPIRVVKRFVDLHPKEVVDMYLTVQNVQKVMEAVHNATGSTLTIQDGKDAGQTVEHVHVHIMPRKPNDFIHNDAIYQVLHFHDKGGVPPRDEQEMIQEADYLRQFFNSTGGFIPKDFTPSTSGILFTLQPKDGRTIIT